jgi:hypothetical protein
MSRKTNLLTLAIGGACCFGVSKASAQFLPGNVWPNPDLSVAAAPGVDQVYSYYNVPYYTPNATGDTNPRPNGWHRGGGDFGTTSAPAYCFYNTPTDSAGEGTTPSGLPTDPNSYALEINDTSQGGYGEWFSDWNALPAGSVAGSTVYLQFYLEYTNVVSTLKPENSDQFRVSVDWGDSVGNDTLTAPNQIGNSVDDIIPAGSPDQATWLQVDETLTVPAGVQSMRITEDSGGQNAATGQIWVSDISVSNVPEPTCIAGITAGSMLLLARRRRAIATA